MFTRRDALKLAGVAAVASTAAGPFAVTPAEAAALLDRPATFAPTGGRGGTGGPDLHEPVAFAEGLDGIDWRDFFELGAAEEMAEYHQLHGRALDAFGVLPRDLANGHPLQLLDEAALGMWCVAWMAGVRAGAAYEHLRLAMVTPTRTCHRCHGQGRTWGGSLYRLDDDGTNGAACVGCGGGGTVPTPAPRGVLAAIGD